MSCISRIISAYILLLFTASSVFSEGVEETLQNGESDVGLNVLQLVKKYGYPLEVHDVKTKDGYILQMHRIPFGLSGNSITIDDQNNGSKREAVLLVHCFLCSSAEWVYMGPNKSLSYILADSGFDVWLGNNRGNTWSRKHVQLDPDDYNGPFWDYSWHEMGFYDLPAMVDHILAVTGLEKIYIIGHSQGTVTTTVMFSTRPEYNEKVKLFTAFAPAVHLTTEPVVRLVTSLIWPFASPILRLLGMKEIMPKTNFLTSFGSTMCSENSITLPICMEVLFAMTGKHPEQFDSSMIPVIVSSTPAGSSWKVVEHFNQIVRSKSFNFYDYGDEGNLIRYGQTTPPQYDLRNLKVPVAMYYGLGDTYVGEEGVLRFAKEIPNPVMVYKLPDEKWNHLDFLWAKDAPKTLYNKTVDVMMKYL